MTNAITKNRKSTAVVAAFRNFLRLACLGEIPGGVPVYRIPSSAISERIVAESRRAAPRAMTFPRVRAVRMLAVRETATACVFSHHRRYDAQVDPSARCLSHPFPSRSDIRFDRFHGWSALAHYVLPSGTGRFATHCHFSAREGSRFKIIGSDTFISLSLRKN